jgi:hypothetical protein
LDEAGRGTRRADEAGRFAAHGHGDLLLPGRRRGLNIDRQVADVGEGRGSGERGERAENDEDERATRAVRTNAGMAMHEVSPG